MNNILLHVINDNFSMLQFTIVLKLFLHCFTSCVQRVFVTTTLLNAQVPMMRICIFLKVFILKWWFHLVLLVWVHLSQQGIYCTLLPNKPHRKKSRAVRSSEWGGHGTSPKQESTRCRNERWSTAMLVTAVYSIAPSCWNHKIWFGGSFMARNSFIICL
jgi:hypothetical protein